MPNIKNEEAQKKIALLNQGAYGCIIRPSIKCSGQVGSDQYVTKIQKKKDTANREVQIGAMISNIPSFTHFFAPVLESCDVTIGTVNSEEIKECEFISKDPAIKYATNKIKYVGKYNITEYLLSVFQNKPQRFFFELLRTYKATLVGVTKLNQSGIIHFDLKDNNIMVRDRDNEPIIIDFGLSITKQLTHREAFFTYGPDYAPWCFDVCLATYAVNKAAGIADTNNAPLLANALPANALPPNASINTLLEVINQFFKENPAMNELLTMSERDEYKKLLTAYVGKYENKPWAAIINELCANQNSWDNYALAVIYLNIMDNMELSEVIKVSPIVSEFREFLKGVVMAEPLKRADASTTKMVFEKMFSRISRGENTRLMAVVKTEANDAEANEVRRSKIARSMLSNIKVPR